MLKYTELRRGHLNPLCENIILAVGTYSLLCLDAGLNRFWFIYFLLIPATYDKSVLNLNLNLNLTHMITFGMLDSVILTLSQILMQ